MTTSSEMITESSIPKFSIGEIVRCRDRLWRIDQINNVEKNGKEHILYSVSSITGHDSNQVLIPTIESIEKATVPAPEVDKIGNPIYQRLLIQALRLDLIYGTSSFISLQNSKVIPISYQMVPVLMALNQTKCRLLIADDVGLGKTVEAGLIIQELMGRKRINRVLFVTPANLREQWQGILRNFFSIDAVIMSRRNRRKLESELLVGGNPWGYFNFIIVSTDYAKRPGIKEEILQFNWDLVIIDEAHNVMKPHGGSENEFSKSFKQSYGLAKNLSEKAKNFLLLTATPHNGYRDCFASLLTLINPEIIQNGTDIKINKDLAKIHVCQRRREDVTKWLTGGKYQKNPFPERDSTEIYIKPSEQFERTIKKLNDFAELILQFARDKNIHEKKLNTWALLHFHKRCISSPFALYKSAENRIKAIEEKLVEKRKKLDLSTSFLTVSEAQQAVMDGDETDRLSEEEMDKRTDQIILAKTVKQLEEEKRHLLGIKKEASQLGKQDTKLYQLLENIIPQRLKESKKIIIFTRYIDTLKYLKKHLLEKKENTTKYKELEIHSIHGQMPSQSRQETYNNFLRTKKGILISTDCMAEGIDLQFSSNQIINYELTWNPNRLEQRNGRIDRFGQPKEKVFIRTLILEDTLEMDILDLLMKKARKIKKDYGFVPSFFGDPDTIMDHITSRSRKQKTLDYFFGSDKVVDDIVSEFFSEKSIKTIVEDSFYGHENINLEEIEERMRISEEQIGNNETILEFLKNSLSLYGSEIKLIEKDEKIYEIKLSESIQEELSQDYQNLNLKYKISPNMETAAKYDDVEGINLKSPIVKTLVESVKNEVFSVDTQFYGRTAAFSSSLVDHLSVICFIKIRYIVNTIPNTIIEEIIPMGFELFEKNPLTRERITEIWNGSQDNANKNQITLQKHVKKALEDKILQELIETTGKDQQTTLINERKDLIQKLNTQGVITDLEGIDDVKVVGTDLLTLTLVYPRVGGAE